MRALVKKYPEHGIWMDDVPEPECDTNDVKIRVTHSAICGTDLHIYKSVSYTHLRAHET